MLLPSPNPSLNRGSHLAVVVEVIRLSPAHVLHDLGINLGPQVVCDRALILYVVALQHASLSQLVERGDDLLKGAIDDSPRLVNVGLYLFQFRFHISESSLTSYTTYRFEMISPILYGCQKIYVSGLANGLSRFALRRKLPKLSSATRSTWSRRRFPRLKTAEWNHACGILNCWRLALVYRWESYLRTCKNLALRYGFPLRRQVLKSQRVCRNHVAKGINPERRRLTAIKTE